MRHFAVLFCEVKVVYKYFYYFQDFKFTSLENNEAPHTGNYMLFPFVHDCNNL